MVNIGTTRVTERDVLRQVPGLDENQLRDFLRRFLPWLCGKGASVERRSLGSSFFVSSDGYILTNAHVMADAEIVMVRLTDGREFRARVVGADRRSDVALIKIDATCMPVVRFGDPACLKVGEWVVAIGSPVGFENSVTAGIASAKGRSLPAENLVPFIQTDVAINPGNSGGPLFNMHGEVVDINSRIYSRTGGFMGLSFAIPIGLALRIQQQLRTQGYVRRGRIGVMIQEVSDDLAGAFGRERARGALVGEVQKGRPAERAGIHAADMITPFNGRPVASSSALPRVVAATAPASHVSLEVWREGAARSLSITVGAPDALPREAHTAAEPARARAAIDRLGVTLGELGASRKKELDPEHGVLMSAAGPGVRAELRRGDVVLRRVYRGKQTETTFVEQLERVLAGLARSASFTLYPRRGDANVFVSVPGAGATG